MMVLADYYDPNPLQTAKSLMGDEAQFAKHCTSLSGIDRNNLEGELIQNVMTEGDLISLYLKHGEPSFVFGMALMQAAGIVKAAKEIRKRKRAERKA